MKPPRRETARGVLLCAPVIISTTKGDTTMTKTSTTPRVQSRGTRVDNSGRVTRRFRNMETGEWFELFQVIDEMSADESLNTDDKVVPMRPH